MTISNNVTSLKGVHNYYIDLFRFILMSWIVLFHYTVQYNVIVPNKTFCFPLTFDNGGAIGVSLFFMVSGFFMTRSLMTVESGLREYWIFIVRRYLRLWIPYAFACVIIYIWLLFLPVEGRTVGFTSLIANIACIIHPGFERVENAHWFLVDLFVVQLLLGLVLFIRSRKYRQIIIYILFAIVMVAQVFSPRVLSGMSKELYEVLLGVQLCILGNDKNFINFLLSIVGLVLGLYLSTFFFAGALLFILLLFIGRKYPIPSSAKRSQLVFQFLGMISFYWYLVHQNIGYSIMYYFIPNGNNCELWVFIPMAITLLISLIVYLFDSQVNKYVVERVPILNKKA